MPKIIDVVDDFEVDPLGVENIDTKVATAYAALPASGGILYFPRGKYLTAGLTFDTVPVVIQGEVGTSETDLVAANVTGTQFVSTTNAPILRFDDSVTLGSALISVSVAGDRTAGTDQCGVLANNALLNMKDVSALYCGGDGILTTWSQFGATYENVLVHKCVGDAFRFSSETSQPGPSLNLSLGVTCISCCGSNCDGSSWHLEGNVQNTTVLAGLSVACDTAVKLVSVSPRLCRYNTFISTWSQDSVSSNTITIDANSQLNNVWLVKRDKAISDSGARNFVHGSTTDAADVGGQLAVPIFQYPMLKAQRLTSSDFDAVRIIDETDDDLGRLAAKNVVAFGQSTPGRADDNMSSAVGTSLAAITIENDEDIAFVDDAGTSTVEAFTCVGTADVPSLPSGVKLDTFATGAIPPEAAAQDGRITLMDGGTKNTRKIVFYLGGKKYSVKGKEF